MKNKHFKLECIIILLTILLGVIIYFYIKNNNTETSVSETKQTTNDSSTTENVKASVQTITNTLSTSSSISAGISEKINLHTSYYFDEIYYEKGDYVKEGENILKYTNETYLAAPYNLVISDLNLPNQNEKCTNKNNISVESLDTLSIKASIKENDLSKLKIGQEVKITISALDNKEYTGYVTSINEVGNYLSSSSKFDITITLQNDGNIKIGMTASCNIVLEKAENVIAVPVEAVQNDDKGKYVTLVKEDGSTEKIDVETGISNGAYIEIKSGISENETVQITKKTNNNTMNQYMQRNMQEMMQKRQNQEKNGMPSNNNSNARNK